MLRNGFGEHNIQGIGDKHIPLIHNVMNTDVALAVSDRATDRLGLLFGTEAGRALPRAAGAASPARSSTSCPRSASRASATCSARSRPRSTSASARTTSIVTVATDGAAMYGSERELAIAKYFPGGFDEVAAAEVFGEHLLGATTDNLRELTCDERERIFNLGYFTWVEQQGVSIEDFEARRDPSFWTREAVARRGAGTS